MHICLMHTTAKVKIYCQQHFHLAPMLPSFFGLGDPGVFHCDHCSFRVVSIQPILITGEYFLQEVQFCLGTLIVVVVVLVVYSLF